MIVIDWTKPIETVPCERNPVPVPCELMSEEDGEVKFFIRGDWFNKNGCNYNDYDYHSEPWTHHGNSQQLDSIPNLRNVELPEETATWWAKRWWQSATDAEKDAMRVLVGSE